MAQTLEGIAAGNVHQGVAMVSVKSALELVKARL